ncbi:hypothetical protein ASAC_1461 [Acidilobus saccharovorans 345-15]|uniref:Uncharacterized protein n=1 Tax=Acidilobus saccharovorans (strain DSM 16705 / JCM 18335 / VKM B-2471 / 345-15) TaxID=666510 RepID=D9PZ79_ACIS3|nr:hypothetical protein [Acidilobus saccharovorans]ADL19866.1 hypothetical protein ASAC_1461 [Acidilobus saccharovorans 345-15]
MSEQKPQEQRPQEAPTELRDVAEMLRDAAAQLRSIIDSLNNPLAAIAANAMQSQQAAPQQPQPREQHSQEAPQEAKRAEQEDVVRPQPRPEATSTEVVKAQPMASQAVGPSRAAAPVIPVTNVERVMKLLNLFADMNILSNDFFESVVKAMSSLGVLSDGERDALVYLLNTMKLGVEKGLSPQEVVSLLAIIFSEAGVDNDEVIRSGLAKVILSKLRRQDESR